VNENVFIRLEDGPIFLGRKFNEETKCFETQHQPHNEYLLVPQNKVSFEERTLNQLAKKLRILREKNVHYRGHNTLPLDHNLRQLNEGITFNFCLSLILVLFSHLSTGPQMFCYK